MPRVVDVHIHLSGREDDGLIRYAKMNRLEYDMGELAGAMRAHGIERGLLLSPPLLDGGILPNEEVLRLCGKSGGLLSPVLTVDPTPRDVRRGLKLAEENRKEVKGFKVRLGYVDAPADDKVFATLYDYAEEEGLPVLFHTGDTATSNGSLAYSHPSTLDAVANEREELVMVICHFGNPWFEDVAELIYKHPNVYADTSGLSAGGGAYAKEYMSWLAGKISAAIYFAGGAEKVLFGTDYPVTTHSNALALVRSLAVTEEDKERILGGNAERVFGL